MVAEAAVGVVEQEAVPAEAAGLAPQPPVTAAMEAAEGTEVEVAAAPEQVAVVTVTEPVESAGRVAVATVTEPLHRAVPR